MTPEEFRAAGHQLIDWIADYRDRLADFPVMARTKPGDLKARLPTTPPEQAEPFDHVFSIDGKVIRYLFEIAAVKQIHDEKRHASELGSDIGVENADDVLAANLRCRAGLALESSDGIGRRAEMRFHHLESKELSGDDMLN